ncbi:MAG TPA: PhzF family isomerase [Candidatus Paceibacterota bacterium]|nr:PhzF family isomerase [Verrucomicrobiota bacterium]HRY48123.1 PhzF family isomerase [Candidatus Paceibacterota bacterium]HSA00604.1 PhzF family isomerase [Candidatus Paceibacterota bacterium]
MKRFRIYQVDAFTTERFRGNPAGVVLNADGLTESQMQALARELNNSETAYVLSPTAADHEVWIRFFTPTTEVPSCGHATIAAHYVRARENGLPACTVLQKIGVGILPVEIIPVGNDYKVVMTQGAVEFSQTLSGDRAAAITGALGLSAADLDARCPIQIVSTGHSKVLIGIRERSKLNALCPDLTRLAAISREIRCNGYYVFTLTTKGDDVLAHGRMFAPGIGIPEDPVTGNANGPLGAFLVKHNLVASSGDTFTFKAQQGEAIGRTGTVEVTVAVREGNPERVQVAGRAVIVFQTDVEL